MFDSFLVIFKKNSIYPAIYVYANSDTLPHTSTHTAGTWAMAKGEIYNELKICLKISVIKLVGN